MLVVFVGLALPAVMKVRDTAARNTCANNLRQIGLALHHYHAVHGYLPPSMYLKPFPQGSAWSAYLLPFLDQEPLYQQINFSLPVSDPVNLAVIETPLKVYQCPSAPQDRAVDFAGAALYGTVPGIHLAIGDYAPLYGVGVDLNFYLPPEVAVGQSGSMVIDETRRFTDITDGTSNTILIAEIAGRPVRWQLGVPLPEDLFNSPGGGWGDGEGAFYLHGILAGGGVRVINGTNLSVYSFHLDGANVLAADGSVHFLGTATDPALLASLVSYRGGENVSFP